MAALYKMPDEILLEILSHLANEKSSIYALALVNKKFSHLTVTLMWRNVELTITVNEEGSSSLARNTQKQKGFFQARGRRKYTQADTVDRSDAYDLFMRKITSKPHLSTYVKNVCLKWSYNTCVRAGNRGRLHEKANRLLEKLPDMEKLSIVTSGTRKISFDPTFLHRNPATRLNDIDIRASIVNMDKIATYMQLPSMSRLTVSSIYWHELMQSTFDESPILNHNLTTPLSFLDLGTRHLHHSTVTRLFQIRPGIRKLWFRLPGRELGHFNMPQFGPQLRMAGSLSPSAIQNCISTLKTNLVELRLSDGWNTSWICHDGSRLDLSQFTALKILHAPSTCFFPSAHSSEERRGVFMLLPVTLKQFLVSFGIQYCFLFETGEFPSLFEEDDPASLAILSEKYKSRYEWVAEIIQSKSTLFPFLSCVSIEEETQESPLGSFQPFTVDSFPCDLRQAALRADIEMQLVLRKPSDFDITERKTGQEI